MRHGRRSERADDERRSPEEPPLVINGWSIYFHPDFADRFQALRAGFERVRGRDPDGYRTSSPAKVFEAVRRLVISEIPGDPGADRFRQGSTLGHEYRHWRRAKFLGRFRLFFRYHTEARIIVFVWLNDENTLRKAGSRSDPYHIFREMLEKGQPPSDWPDLIAASATVRGSATGTGDAAGARG
jgi:toxin YhaV